MGIFGSDKRSVLKRELVDLYSSMMKPVFGPFAKKIVNKMVKEYEEQIKAKNLDNLPDNFGEIVVDKLYKENSKVYKHTIDMAYDDGATREDIIEYYNLDYLQRLMVEWTEKVFRDLVFTSYVKEDNLSKDEAFLKICSIFPMYGDPNDTTYTQGEDRPLSPILRGRIDIYRELFGAVAIAKEVEQYSSYNAYVRFLIRNNKL